MRAPMLRCYILSMQDPGEHSISMACRQRLWTGLIVATVGCGTVVRADPIGSTHECARIAEDDRRLACYDRAFGDRVGTGDSSAESALPADATRDSGPGNVDGNGRARADQPPSEDPELVVASIDRRQSGEQVFTMANGQVWVEVEGHTRFRLKPGETVTIRKAALGSFMLVTSHRTGTKVRRVR